MNNKNRYGLVLMISMFVMVIVGVVLYFSSEGPVTPTIADSGVEDAPPELIKVEPVQVSIKNIVSKLESPSADKDSVKLFSIPITWVGAAPANQIECRIVGFDNSENRPIKPDDDMKCWLSGKQAKIPELNAGIYQIHVLADEAVLSGHVLKVDKAGKLKLESQGLEGAEPSLMACLTVSIEVEYDGKTSSKLDISWSMVVENNKSYDQYFWLAGEFSLSKNQKTPVRIPVTGVALKIETTGHSLKVGDALVVLGPKINQLVTLELLAVCRGSCVLGG